MTTATRTRPEPATGPTVPSALTILLFIAAVAIGTVLAFTATRQGAAPPQNPFPGLPALGAEPHVAADLVAAIARDDAAAVAAALPAEHLQVLGQFLDPIFDATSARYLGGVEKDGEAIVAYLVEGLTENGDQTMVGLTLRVKDGKVVGIQ